MKMAPPKDPKAEPEHRAFWDALVALSAPLSDPNTKEFDKLFETSTCTESAPRAPFPDPNTKEFNDLFDTSAPTAKMSISDTTRASAWRAEGTNANDLMFVDSTFDELAVALAQLFGIQDEVQPLLEKKDDIEVIKKLIVASTFLHKGPDNATQQAFVPLIWCVFQVRDYAKLIPRLLEQIMAIPVNPVGNGFQVAMFLIQSVFNVLVKDDHLKYDVFGAMVKFCDKHGNFDLLKQSLDYMPSFLKSWKATAEEQRSIYLRLADAAEKAESEAETYTQLVRALNTFEGDEISSKEAQDMALRTVRMVLLSSSYYIFQDLVAVPAVQALNDTQPIWTQLLEIFAEQELEDYVDFLDEHETFIEDENLNEEKLFRKMRILTFASLAAHASSHDREIDYKLISKALQIPVEDVEMWAIDVIRAGLVEGKLSQKRKVFLVHRATYRVFSDKQWRWLETRTEQLKNTYTRVLDVIDKGEKDAIAQKKRDEEEASKKLSQLSTGGDGGNRNKRREYQPRNKQREPREPLETED